jgi:hypothetical protein
MLIAIFAAAVACGFCLGIFAGRRHSAALDQQVLHYLAGRLHADLREMLRAGVGASFIGRPLRHRMRRLAARDLVRVVGSLAELGGASWPTYRITNKGREALPGGSACAALRPTDEQPAPVPERPDLPAVWDLVLADLPSLPTLDGFRHDGPACYRLLLRMAQLLAAHLGTNLAADMRERDATGRARYGTPLQPFNGRQALVDAYQELLDAAVYLRQHIYERDSR